MRKINSELRTGTLYHEPRQSMPVRLAQRHVPDWASLLGTTDIHLDIVLLTR